MTDFKPSAKVIADSVSKYGDRLTTMEITFHRFILPELNTHRRFSKNSASSRAIPFQKLVEKVLAEDVFPLEWASEKPGMQGGTEVDETTKSSARDEWISARDAAIFAAEGLVRLGVHKSIVNRLIEPFAPHTVIVSSTEWDNFWVQRISPLAQPEMRELAIAMKSAYDSSVPKLVNDYGWHLPFVQDDELHLDIEMQRRISAARCARASYLTHDGKRDIDKDFKLFSRLVSAKPRHYSPLEHVATPSIHGSHVYKDFSGNYDGWYQLRHLEWNW